MKYSINLLRYCKAVGSFILFAWISFFPEPIQDRYSFWVRIFLGVFLLILALGKNSLRRLFEWRDWPLWLFLACLAGGIVCATDKKVAVDTYWYLALNLFLLFYIGENLYSDIKFRDTVNLIICICGGLVALFGILEVIYAVNPIYKYLIDNPFYSRYISRPVRPMSTLLNPAPLATYLLLILPFAIYVTRDKSRFKKILGIVVSALGIICLVLTFCRSSFLGLVVMLFFYLYIQKKYKILMVISLFFIIFLTITNFLPYPYNRLSYQGLCFDGTAALSQYRVNRMAMAWQMFTDSPIFGVGLNHFRVLFDQYSPRPGQDFYEIKIADNMHLTLMAEIGIAGLLGFWMFIILLFKNSLERFSRITDIIKKNNLFLIISGLAGFLVSMYGYELFYWANPYMFFCLVCGFVQGLLNEDDARSRIS